MPTILKHAQGLVYSLVCLMPSVYQKASLQAMLRLFLDVQGHAVPEHTPIKSSSSLSRFLNRYDWSTRSVLRTTRRAILEQVALHRPPSHLPIRLLIDLTTLEKAGKFSHLSTDSKDAFAPEPWVRMLNGKRGLHLVVLYIATATNVCARLRATWLQYQGFSQPELSSAKWRALYPHWRVAHSLELPDLARQRSDESESTGL